ncbi:hypothetical protein Tco_1528144, partial [Tanacetum coccineum]
MHILDPVWEMHFKSTVRNSLEKTPLPIDKSRSCQTHDKHQALKDALLNSLILDDDIARGQADAEKVLRKRDRDDEDPSARPNQGKKTRRSRTKESEPSKKSSTSKESSKDDTTQTKDKAPKYDWFKQPPRPPTPDPEWNTRQVVDDQPEQPWFNNMVSAAKDPLTFDKLMATPIDFSKYAINRLKIDKLTKAHLVVPVYNLLNGTCQRDRCPFDLSKPLPLKGRPGRLTVPSDYFFNNDLEYLKSSDLKKKYTMSIIKMKAARYELVGIEDMIPSLWSVTKVGYDKDAERGIKHWGPKR